MTVMPPVAAAWAVADARAAERLRLAEVPAGSLMQRAAAGLAAVCAVELRRSRGRVTGSRVVLLVGSGDNGGDALWAGARLAVRGARVDAVACSPTVHTEGAAALAAEGGLLLPLEGDPDGHRARGLLERADLVVDGIVGLGGAPGLRAPASGIVAALDRFRAGREGGGRPVVVAVDLPSGVDPDTGEVPGGEPGAAVTADVTVTFGTLKPCLLLPPASARAGRVELVDLGLAPHLTGLGDGPTVERLDDASARALWPVPGPDDDKYRRGVVGVVAGSRHFGGAAVLAVGGALRAGAGMVRYLGPDGPDGDAGAQVRSAWPEAVTAGGRVQAWVLGPGVDPEADDGQAGRIEHALASGLPCVLDAGALALIGVRPGLRDRLGAHTVLTPHAGEAARLLAVLDPAGGAAERADVEARPLRHLRRLVAATGATVLLKGAVTLVAGPGGDAPGLVRSQADAPPWLATAGAGDVLAGVTGTLLAAGLDPLDAASLAALVHGRAARLASAGGPLLAGDVAAALPAAVAALLAPPAGRPAGRPVGR